MSVIGDRVVEGSQQGLRDVDVVTSQAPNPPANPFWCYWCGSRDNLRRCGRCHSAFYCSKEHQRLHWRTHREECRERVRPEELQPSNDRETEYSTLSSSMLNFDYSPNTITTDMTKSNDSSQLPPQSDLDSLLTVNTFDTSQLGAITALLPSTLEDNFNNIDLSMLLDDNESNSSNWAKVQPESFSEGSLPVSSSVELRLQDSQQTPELQENSMLQAQYTQLTPPPPYEYKEDLSFVSSNLDSSDINSSNHKNSNLLMDSITPGGSNRLQIPQQFLYELTDLTVTESASRDNLPLDSVPLPESPATVEFLNRVCSNVVNDMNQFGICVIDNFLGKKTGEAILAEVKEMYSDGMFQEGQLVTSSRRTISQTIRGDRITWVDGTEDSCRFVGLLIHTLDSIVSRCQKMKNCGLFGRCKINRRTKAMIACYPGNGTHYVKHVDNPNQDGRCITSIYYLNQEWDIQLHGGLLRMFPAGCNNQVANIEPLFDRILFFWSDRRNPHEVLPAFSVRFAITVWYCDAEERNKAILRFGEEMQKRKKDAQDLDQIRLHP